MEELERLMAKLSEVAKQAYYQADYVAGNNNKIRMELYAIIEYAFQKGAE